MPGHPPPVSSHCTPTCQESIDYMEAYYKNIIWINARPTPSRFVTLHPNLPGISRLYGGILKHYLNQLPGNPPPVSSHHTPTCEESVDYRHITNTLFGTMPGHPPPVSSYWPPTCHGSINIIKSYLQVLSHD